MNDDDSKFFAPDAAFILALAKATIASLPDVFRRQAASITYSVQDFVADDHFEDLGLEDPYELASLFQSSPDTIWLYRRPILDEWAKRGDVCLADLVTHVLLPELAHHFGWTDAKIMSYTSLSAALRAAQRRQTAKEG